MVEDEALIAALLQFELSGRATGRTELKPTTRSVMAILHRRVILAELFPAALGHFASASVFMAHLYMRSQPPPVAAQHAPEPPVRSPSLWLRVAGCASPPPLYGPGVLIDSWPAETWVPIAYDQDVLLDVPEPPLIPRGVRINFERRTARIPKMLTKDDLRPLAGEHPRGREEGRKAGAQAEEGERARS